MSDIVMVYIVGDVATLVTREVQIYFGQRWALIGVPLLKNCEKIRKIV